MPQNLLVSDRIKGFCDAVCAPESTSFGPDKGVLQWCRSARCAHNPPISDWIKGFCDSGLPDAKIPAARISLSPQAMSRNELPAVLDPKIIPEQHCL